MAPIVIESVLLQSESEVVEIAVLSAEQMEFIGGGQATVNTI
jgi:hypothetical protein